MGVGVGNSNFGRQAAVAPPPEYHGGDRAIGGSPHENANELYTRKGGEGIRVKVNCNTTSTATLLAQQHY